MLSKPIKKGDMVLCIDQVNNVFNRPLFIAGQAYKVLDIFAEQVYMKHELHGMEYGSFTMEFMNKYFDN